MSMERNKPGHRKLLPPIKIGNEKIQSGLFLAPMAGITDYPFRVLARRYGAAMVVSEMVSSQAITRNAGKSKRLIYTAGREYPLAVQISGSDPALMAESARIARSYGAAFIDINMGCPQRKIVKTGAGAALMKDECLAGNIITSVVAAVDIPVTVKIRLGWDGRNMNAVRIARIAEDCGAAMITVHGRTRSQMFSGTADWDSIRLVKQAVSVPVLANGDIRNCRDAWRCLDESGADGIMIGRGALGRPWLFKEIACFFETGLASDPPDLPEQYAVASEHLDRLIDFYGPVTGVWIARKHLAWYSKGSRGGADFRRTVNAAETMEEIRVLLENHYNRLVHETGPYPPDAPASGDHP